MHARTICVENTRHLDREVMLAAIIEEQGFGAAFTLVVAGAGTYGIDIAPVAFLLRVNAGVAIDLRSRGLQDLRLHALGEPEHVDSAEHADLRGLDGIELVVNG